MAATVIRNFIAKALFKKKGAIANNKSVDFSANALEQRLKNLGIDPNAITNENELNQILSYVKQAEDQAFSQRFGDMLGGSRFDRQGEVFDMTGKKLDSSRGIMGGTQVDEKSLKEGLMKTDNPFSDLVKTTEQGPKTLKEREAEVLARMNRENKEAAQRIRDRKKLDDPEDMAQGGRAGFDNGGAPSIVLNPKDEPMGPGFETNDPEEAAKEIIKRLIKVDGAQIPLTEEGLLSLNINNLDEQSIGGIIKLLGGDLQFGAGRNKDDAGIGFNFKKSFAEGGRIGLKAGMTKRAFLKLMGTGAAGIAALKSGLLGLGKGTATKQVVKEVADQGIRSTPPPYFFELANKIKTLGKPDKVTYADRVEIHRYTGKNGDEYELIEDLNTGDIRIQKDKMGGSTYGDESFDVIDDRTVLEYRKGEVGVKDEGMDTQKTFKEADEYEEYKVEFDVDGTEADATNLDEIVQKEIIEEATGDAPSIKKAGGGIARMLGE